MPNIIIKLRRSYVLALKKSKIASSLATRLTQWTGKSRWLIHPKHLVDVVEPWYVSFLKSTDRVLDVGCANGQHTLRAAPRVKEIVGIDYDPELIRIAREDAERRGFTNVRFEIGSVEERLNFPDASFDVVLFLDVLEHLNNRDLVLDEIHRVLKPGGTMLLAIPNSETTWKKKQRALGINSFSDPDHKIEYSEDEIIAECKKHNFRVDRIEPIVYDVWYVGLIDLIGGFSLSLYKKLGQWKYRYAHDHPEESIGFEIVAVKE